MCPPPTNQHDWREEEFATAFTKYSLEDQMLYLVPRRQYKGERGGVEIEDTEKRESHYGQVGYILVTYCRYFYNICIRYPQVLTNHWIILVEHRGCI